jgi:exodeoxyribonuclease VII large subunit
MTTPAEHIYTPSELNREIKLHIEMGFPRILVEAEISNLARPGSGHLYFTLKDEKAQIRCALFRSSASRLTIRPENGMKVLARGRVSLYEARGEYQMIVEGLEDAGLGLLQKRFEELKARLEKEGLFDARHKKPLPSFPARIALVTSPTGAAVRDLQKVLARRWPVADVRLYPVRVQGEEATGEIFRAIRAANRHGWADTLILGRGGGSLEDLMAFNDESVARAVFESEIPVVSAVGHETDFSICDFVADLRAPTPSAAAELATPDQAVLRERFSRSQRQLHRRMQDRLMHFSQKTDHLAHRLQQRHPLTQLAEQAKRVRRLETSLRTSWLRHFQDVTKRLDGAARRLHAQQPAKRIEALRDRLKAARRSMDRAAIGAVSARREQLRQLARTLNAVSPLETLGRGYAIVLEADSGRAVTSTSQVQTGDRLTTHLSDGSLESTVDSVQPGSPDQLSR